MQLNIYNKKEIVKTYTADCTSISFGLMEDLAAAVDIDKFTSGTDGEIMGATMKFVLGSMGTVKEMLKEIFDGITDEEIRNATLPEICSVFADVVRYTIDEITTHIRSKNR